MSKTAKKFPDPLTILRFDVPSKSSRTLSATQAYDANASGITLASSYGRLVDKSVAVKTPGRGENVITSLQVTFAGIDSKVGGIDSKVGGIDPIPIAGTGWGFSATLWADKEAQRVQKFRPDTFSFIGTSSLVGGLIDKPRFYGSIPVGTGVYKKWQGNNAILKINTVTGKGVLRIYEE